MSRGLKLGLAAVLLLVVAGGAFWYVALRDTAEPEADLADLDDELDAAGTTAPAGDDAEPEGLDGEWLVSTTSDDAFVGYRIDELYGPGQTVKTTVTGRTNAVQGSVTVDGLTVTDAQFEAEMATLESDHSRRDETLRIRGLETDTYPTATFDLTEPISLEALPAEGEAVEVEANGELTLHGVTRPVTLPLTAKWSGDTVSVEGSLPIELGDYDIEAIDIPQFVAIDDHGTMELLLLLERGS